MSTETTDAAADHDERGRIERLLSSPFVSDLLANRVALIGLAIIDIAALSFLGFGAQAGAPSWGLMLSNGVENGLQTGQWWMSFFPGLFLALTVLGFNLLGDGMRDALDPRMQDTVD